jgi:thiol-disulfide isomerase/thioredoxin
MKQTNNIKPIVSLRAFGFLLLISLFTVLIPSTGFSQNKPYKENQDLRADLRQSVSQATKENKHILVQFGGNWCPWCLRFHAMISGTPKLDSLMKENYIYLLLNIPKEKDKRDYALLEEFGYPNRFGFPVFLILDKLGNRLNTQDSDLFEHPNPAVKGYDTTKVVRFLQLWTPKALDPKTYGR